MGQTPIIAFVVSSINVILPFFSELFKMADYYGEENLQDRCVNQLKLLTTVNNVCCNKFILLLYR